MKIKGLSLVLTLLTLSVFSQRNITDSLGIKQGKWEFFDEKSGSFKVCNYVNGVLDGEYKIISSEEYLLYEVDYVKGKKEGWERNYQKKYRLEKMSLYKEDTLKYYIKFSASGRVYEEAEMNGEKRNGKYKLYWSNGNLFLKKEYLNGVLIGEEVQYYKNGRAKYIFHHKDGEMLNVEKFKRNWFRSLFH